MTVRPTLICFFFLSLQDGNSGLAKAQIFIYTGTEGEDIRVKCSSSQSGNTKFFCKNECKQGDLLIETTDVTAQSGRYGMEYEKLRPGANVWVSISQLTKSDSGLYRCGLGRPLSPDLYADFEIRVVDALLDRTLPEVRTLHKTSGDNVVVGCFFPVSRSRKYFCKERCEDEDILVQTSDVSAQTDRYSIEYVRGSPSRVFVYVSISQLTRSDSGLYRCGLDRRLSLDPYREFRIVVTDAAGVLLYVGLTLVVLVLVLVFLSLLILCRRRRSKAKERPVETEYAVTETNRVYEDIREDGQRRSPPVEISSGYSSAKYSKPSAAETNDDYSVITAANLQNTAEEDSGRLTYSEVHFTNRAASSPTSALRGDADHVVYSVPRVRDGSDAAPPEDDPPVYSTVH
ncbi:uncharacterized protein LOC120559833 isoform X2 [Perca fluviatilis]|uniref:uncharacterized protein LOC120559833 isoform X2 n=1 Tax=Perca fluviatilis TaxID=8168 RepID=UPI001963A574|nr:uncharacterized protein LOC120559833 isoform X2 [Perca fluviatilis]